MLIVIHVFYHSVTSVILMLWNTYGWRVAFYRVRAPYMEPILSTTDDPHMSTVTLESRSNCGMQDGSVLVCGVATHHVKV